MLHFDDDNDDVKLLEGHSGEHISPTAAEQSQTQFLDQSPWMVCGSRSL